jgi:hypothetical protein
MENFLKGGEEVISYGKNKGHFKARWDIAYMKKVDLSQKKKKEKDTSASQNFRGSAGLMGLSKDPVSIV